MYFWFDLGNVLVETRDGFDKLRWMPGAEEVLEKIRARGFSVGLISNIPEDWGRPGDIKSKIDKLQETLRDGWIDSRPVIDLSKFDKVYVPMVRADAKPALKLFLDALRLANSQGRDCLFQGESPREVQAATEAGMQGFLVEFDETGRKPKYFPMDQVLTSYPVGFQ